MCSPEAYDITCEVARDIDIRNKRYIIPGWCGPGENFGTGYRIDACSRLGEQGEFGNEAFVNNGCHYWADFPGCEGGHVIGNGVSCQRLSFAGNISSCCLNPGSCFSTPGDSHSGTCGPNARSTLGSDCQAVYLAHCGTPRVEDLEARWAPTALCSRVLDDNYRAGESLFVSNLGTALMSSYFKAQGPGVSEPDEPGYTPFQDRIHELAMNYPNFGNYYLENTLCPRYSRNDLSTSPAKREFCGCSLSADKYETFSNIEGGVSTECDSLCTPNNVIKRIDINGDPILCGNNICIIDDVTVNLVKSTVGAITFGQVCGACGAGTCTCILKDVTLTGENSTIGDINFAEDCGNDTVCYQTADDGTVKNVKCSTPQEQKDNANNQQQPFNKFWVITAIVIAGILVFILLFLGLFFIGRRRRKNKH